jgi:hypothetical protein
MRTTSARSDKALHRSLSSLALEPLESRTLLSSALLGTSHISAESRSPLVAVHAQAAVAVALTNSIVSSKVPTTLAITDPLASTVQVKVLNSGPDVTPTGASVTVSVFLRPASGADISIGSKPQSFAKLKAGTGSQSVTVAVNVPAGLAVGTYSLVAKVTASGFTPTAAPEAVSTTPIQVQHASIVLSNGIASSTVPATITSKTKSATVQVRVANAGNVVTGKTAQVSVTVALRPTTGGADVILGTKNAQSFANTKVGAFKNVPVSLKFPTSLAAGNYTLVVTVTPSGFTPDANNVITSGGITVSAGSTSSGSFLGKLGNTLRLTDLIETLTNTLPNGLGTTTTTHWHFVDEKNQTGELFILQNVGAIAKAADATINIFPDAALGSGSVVLKGKDASRLALVGTTFTFGTSGSISCTTDTFTGKPCKVSRVN